MFENLFSLKFAKFYIVYSSVLTVILTNDKNDSVCFVILRPWKIFIYSTEQFSHTGYYQKEGYEESQCKELVIFHGLEMLS
jgi:hypothetical protein